MEWSDQMDDLRARTPGASAVIHLNNAGCSLPSAEVLDATIAFLQAEAMQGGYEAAASHAVDLERPYTALASLLNCSPDEIAVVPSATAAWQQVVYGLAWTWRPGDRLLTSLSEYGSNYIAYLQLAKRTGVQIEAIPETSAGDIDLAALEAALTAPGQPLPVLISITHVPTSSGRVYNAAGVGQLAKRYGVLYCLDACQSVGQLPVDVAALGVDFLSGTGRKFLRGPRGSGFLFCAAAAMARFEPAALDSSGASWTSAGNYELSPTARRFQSYEMTVAAKVGLGVALQQCLELGIDAIWARVQVLAAKIRSGLRSIPGVRVWDHGVVLCGIVSFTKEGTEPVDVQQRLAKAGINTSVSAAPSTLLDFQQRGLTAVVRASVHYYNDDAEISQLLHAVEAI